MIDLQAIMRRESRKACSTEHNLQVACVNWFRMQYPHARHLLFAIPNGGQRNAVVAARMKAEGVLAGVPDLLLAAPSNGAHGLFIEMKNGRAGRVSEEQGRMIAGLQAQGYRVEVCRSFEDFVETVRDYLRSNGSTRPECENL